MTVCELKMLNLTTTDLAFTTSPTVTVTPTNEIKLFQSQDADEAYWILFYMEIPRTDTISLSVKEEEVATVTLSLVQPNGTRTMILSQVAHITPFA